jgi:hypothetical protein
MYNINLPSKTQRKKSKPDKYQAWVRKHFSNHGYGIRYPGQDRVGRPSNEDTIDHYKKYGRPSTWRNDQFRAHERGEFTLFGWGDGRYKTHKTFLTVDIDATDSDDAIAFADFVVKEGYLPKMYHEKSTHGIGRHGYVCLYKYLNNGEWVQLQAKILEKALKRVLVYWQAKNPHQTGIKAVEIKGVARHFEYNKAGEIISITGGSLVKLPREGRERWDELKNTTVLDGHKISLIASRADKLTIAFPKRKKSSGSAAFITDEFFEEQIVTARSWAKGRKELQANSRFVVTREDLAIWRVIAEKCMENPNPDESMPTSRFAAVWTDLFDRGLIDRPWNHHRHKAIRDQLEEEGIVQMINRGYWVGNEESRGQAARWRVDFAAKNHKVYDADTISFTPVLLRRSFVDTASEDEPEKLYAEYSDLWFEESSDRDKRIGLVFKGSIGYRLAA